MLTVRHTAAETQCQQAISDNEQTIANLQNELNAMRAEDTDLWKKQAEQRPALEMQLKELEQALPLPDEMSEKVMYRLKAMSPTTEIDKTELAVLRAERDIYKSVADRLLDK